MLELVTRSRVPNALTISRVPLSVAVYMLMLRESYVSALGLLVLAQMTDWVDGPLARRWHAQTRFGVVVEHVVDSLMLVLPALALTQVGAVPAWLFVAGCVYCALSWVAPERIRRVWVLNAVLGMRSLLYGLAVAIIPFLLLRMISAKHPLLGVGIFCALVVYALGTIYWKRGRIQYYGRRFVQRLRSSVVR